MATVDLLPILSSIGDPDGTRTVTSIIVLLIAIGLALILLAVWIHRTTRPDPDLLAPLEIMGERSWRRGDPVWQRRRLDEVRPRGAKPLVPSAAPPELDASFEEGPTATGFDDLRLTVVAPGDVAAVDDGDDPVAEPPSDSTPSGVGAVDLDGLGDDEFDPEALAAARDELERELAESSHEQLDLFDDGRHA